jgi:hypothetical protein
MYQRCLATEAASSERCAEAWMKSRSSMIGLITLIKITKRLGVYLLFRIIGRIGG